ncbi:unnamed protein product [Symbiodinium microadriaticum]|nr:unnamed protein product [Symbiodinium microadriaticum]
MCQLREDTATVAGSQLLCTPLRLALNGHGGIREFRVWDRTVESEDTRNRLSKIRHQVFTNDQISKTAQPAVSAQTINDQALLANNNRCRAHSFQNNLTPSIAACHAVGFAQQRLAFAL